LCSHIFRFTQSLAVAFGPMFAWNPAVIGDKRHLAAVSALAQARQEAQEVGHERRREIRRRVEENRRRTAEESEGMGDDSRA
jgi:hypothetical protein